MKLVTVPLSSGYVPPTPHGLIPQARQVWKQLWGTNLAGAYKDSDWPGLRRWIWYLSEWLKASKDFEMEPYAETTEEIKDGVLIKKTIVRNMDSQKVRMAYLFKCEKALRELERAYGMDALARLRLGLTLVEEHNAVKSLKEPAPPKEVAV